MGGVVWSRLRGAAGSIPATLRKSNTKSKGERKMEERTFGGLTEVSAEMRRRALPAFEQMLKDNLIREAEHQGYRVTSEVELKWDERAFKRVDGEDGYFTLAKCDDDEPGAFYNVRISAMAVPTTGGAE